MLIEDLKRDNIEFLDSPRNVVVGVRSARAVVAEVIPGSEKPAEGAEEKPAE